MLEEEKQDNEKSVTPELKLMKPGFVQHPKY